MKPGTLTYSFDRIFLKTLLIFFFAITFGAAKAQVIYGKISDENDKPVPYATIFISETKEGTTSNIDGN